MITNIINTNYIEKNKNKIKVKSIEPTLGRMFLKNTIGNKVEQSIHFERGLIHKSTFGSLIYQLKLFLLNFLGQTDDSRDIEHKNFIDEIATKINNLNIGTLIQNVEYNLYSDIENKIDIILKKINNNSYNIEISSVGILGNKKSKIFNKFNLTALNQFKKDAEKYLKTCTKNENETNINILNLKERDIFGNIDNDPLAVIIKYISIYIFNCIGLDILNNRINTPIGNNKIDSYIINFIKDIVNKNEKISLQRYTNNIFNIEFKKSGNSYYILIKALVKEKKIEFLLLDETNELQLINSGINQKNFNISDIKKSISIYENNLLAKYLQGLKPIDKIKLILKLNEKISIQFFNEIFINYFKNFIIFKGIYQYQFGSFEELKKQILSMIKSYNILVGGTWSKYDNKKNSLDNYYIIGGNADEKLDDLKSKNYTGYIYIKKSKKLYHISNNFYEQENDVYGPNTYGKITIAKLCSNCITIGQL
jgi:hypothetical protein